MWSFEEHEINSVTFKPHAPSALKMYSTNQFLFLFFFQICKHFLLQSFLKVKHFNYSVNIRWFCKNCHCHDCVHVCCEKTVPYRLGTALWARQPPPLLQHLHQADDGHLTVGSTNHTEEELCGGGQGEVREETTHEPVQYWVHSDLNLKQAEAEKLCAQHVVAFSYFISFTFSINLWPESVTTCLPVMDGGGRFST